MSTAIRDASVSLKTVLETRLNADADVQAMLPPGGSLDVSLNTPEEMGDASERGLSVWLYRIVRDDSTLNAPPRRVAPDRVRLTPLPLRLHYLVTPVFPGPQGVSAPEFEQTLLGKVLQHFHEEPFVGGGALVGGLAGRDLELAVRLETLDLDEVTRVWDALDRAYQLCLSYEVSVLPIEARRDIPTGPPVGVLVANVGVGAEAIP
ncbi:DUF4255 domain-containing protein [Azospirillum largimobile]